MNTRKSSKEMTEALMGTWNKMRGIPAVTTPQKPPASKSHNASRGLSKIKSTTKQRAKKKGRILTAAQDYAALNDLRFWVDECLRSQKTASASTGEKDRVRAKGFVRFLKICTPEVNANWNQYSSVQTFTDIRKINLSYDDFNSGVASAILWDSLYEPILLNGKGSQFNKHLVQLQTRLQAIYVNVLSQYLKAHQLEGLYEEIGKELTSAKKHTDVITHLLATSYVLRNKGWW